MGLDYLQQQIPHEIPHEVIREKKCLKALEVVTWPIELVPRVSAFCRSDHGSDTKTQSWEVQMGVQCSTSTGCCGD
jgi:hypothetical protein